jgi:hypothetical protein
VTVIDRLRPGARFTTSGVRLNPPDGKRAGGPGSVP